MNASLNGGGAKRRTLSPFSSLAKRRHHNAHRLNFQLTSEKSEAAKRSRNREQRRNENMRTFLSLPARASRGMRACLFVCLSGRLSRRSARPAHGRPGASLNPCDTSRVSGDWRWRGAAKRARDEESER